MNILVYGAGVLGSLYAARLRSAGHRVSLLARGRRLADLRRYGLALENAITGRKTFALVNAVERPDPDEAYDLALVPVRKTQLPEVLPALSAGHRIPAFLFMVCNAEGPDAMIRALGRDRVLMGYAGAGGIRTGPLVRYTRVSPLLQRTVIGEVDGRITPRLKSIRKAFVGAGFPTVLSPNIDAWLKTHVAWVCPVAQALYREGGDILRLADSRESVRLMVRAIHDGFRVLEGLGVPPTGPFWVRSQAWVPEPMLVRIWRRALRTRMALISMAWHANSTREEMSRVANDFRTLVKKAGIPTPALDRLSLSAGQDIP
jgi:2-dehydropantoate 2-reductase